MPLVPNLFERQVLLRFNLAPRAMLDFLGAQAFRAACAGFRLGVFDALVHGALSASEIAERISADARGTRILLDALVALGYVEERDSRYSNSAHVTKWFPLLREGMPFFQRLIFERWADLEDTIRGGKPERDPYEWLNEEPERWREFQAGMNAVAQMTADAVVARVSLPSGARQLLDVGGGHGVYAIKFCRRWPALSATIFDLPGALGIARESIAAARMENRISLLEGDFWEDDLPGGNDVVLLFNIVHAYLPDRNTELLGKVSLALNPGGQVVILDQLAGSRALGPIARATAQLNGLNLFHASGGQAYAFDEIVPWLEKVGFSRARRIGLLRSPGSGLVVATKEA